MRMYPEPYDRFSEVEPVRTSKVKSIIFSALSSLASIIEIILSIGALLCILGLVVCLIMVAYQNGGVILAIGAVLAFVLVIFTGTFYVYQ